MSIDRVNKLATGEVFLGSEAKKLGLVDALGTRQDAINYIETKLNITAKPIEYKEKKSFSDLLAEFSSYFRPGIGKFINPASNNVQFI